MWFCIFPPERVAFVKISPLTCKAANRTITTSPYRSGKFTGWKLILSHLSCLLTMCMCVCVCVCVWERLSRVRLCDPMNCRLPGFPVHGILQARILEWIAIPFSRGSPWPRDWTLVSCIAGSFFTTWAIGKSLLTKISMSKLVFWVKFTHSSSF